MPIKPIIPDPIDTRTTAEKVSGYGGGYVPDLPELKADRLAQYGVGNIPLYGLSQWEQREATTGQSYTDYMGEVKIATKARIAAEGEASQLKKKAYLDSLLEPSIKEILREEVREQGIMSTQQGIDWAQDTEAVAARLEAATQTAISNSALYDAELKKLEMDRIQNMSNFEEEYGWSFEDTLAFARGEGPKYDRFLQMGGENRPGAREYLAQNQAKVDAAETILWKNANNFALINLSDNRTPQEVEEGALSQYSQFVQDRYDWQFSRDIGNPWKGNIQEMMLASGVDFTGPITQMSMDDYRAAGAFKPGDEFGWETARLYGVHLEEGEILRIEDPKAVTYTILTPTEVEGEYTERELDILEYEEWIVGESHLVDDSKLRLLGYNPDDFGGLPDDMYTVTLNDEDQYQILEHMSGDWTFNITDGSATHMTATGPVDYTSGQMNVMEDLRKETEDIAADLYPDFMATVVEMHGGYGGKAYVPEGFVGDPDELPWLNIFYTYTPEGEQIVNVPQFSNSTEFLSWAGETNDEGMLVNSPWVQDIIKKSGQTPESDVFLREFYGMEQSDIHKMHTGFNPSAYDQLKGTGTEATMAMLEALHMPSLFISRLMAFVQANAVIWIAENIDYKLADTRMFDYKRAQDYVEAYTNSVGPGNEFGFMYDEKVHAVYNDMLPSYLRIAYESLPYLLIPAVTRGIYGALEIPTSVPGFLSRGPLRFVRGSMRFGIRADEKMASGIAMSLRGGLGLPSRMRSMYKFSKTYKGQTFTSAQGRRMLMETLLDKQLLNWALKRTAYGPAKGNKAWQLLWNKHGREIGKLVKQNLKQAELELAGKVPAEAMAYEAGALAIKKTVQELTESKSSHLAQVARNFLKAEPVKPVPYPYQLAKEKVEAQGGILTKTESVGGEEMFQIALRNGEKYPGNIQQITNWIDEGSLTGLAGRDMSDAFVGLLGKQASLSPEDRWMFNRILHEMTPATTEQAYNAYLKSRLHISGPASQMPDVQMVMEGMALPGTGAVSDDLARLVEETFFLTDNPTPAGRSVANMLTKWVKGDKPGADIDALEERVWQEYVASFMAYEDTEIGRVWIPTRLNKALSSGKIEAPTEGIDPTDVLGYLRVVGERETADVAVPGSIYEELLKVADTVAFQVQTLGQLKGVGGPAMQGLYKHDLRVYNWQKGILDDIINKIGAKKDINMEDALQLQMALAYTNKAPQLRTMLELNGMLVDKSFVDAVMAGKIKDIQPWSEQLGTPIMWMGEADAGIEGGAMAKFIHVPTNQMRMAMMHSNQVWMGKSHAIAEKYNLLGNILGKGPKNKRWRNEALFDVMEALDDSRAAFGVTELLGDKKIISIMNKWKVPAERWGDIVGAGTEVRTLLDSMFSRVNLMRKLMGRELIPYIGEKDLGYIPYIKAGGIGHKMTRFLSLGEESASVDGVMSIFNPLIDYMVPNNPRFVHALERMGFKNTLNKDKDVFRLLERYIEGANKDIFYSPVIQNHKLHSQVLRSWGLTRTSHAVDKWTAETLSGLEPVLDRAVTAVTGKVGPIKFGTDRYLDVRRALNTAVFPFNWAWTLGIQTSSIALTVRTCGAKNTLLGFLDYAQNTNQCRDHIKKAAYSYGVKTEAGGSIINMDPVIVGRITGQRFSQTYFETANHYANFMMRHVEALLTGGSIQAGYRTGWDLGYRGGMLWHFASNVGAKTQSMYNFNDAAGFMRNRWVGAIFPFQTFSIEMMNAVREMSGIRIFRTGAWQTVAASSATGQGEIKRRLWRTGQWVAAMVAINEMVSRVTGRDPYTLASAMPFSGLLFGGMTMDDPYQLALPYKIQRDLVKAIESAIKWGDYDKLVDFGLGYLTMGGAQIRKTMRGAFAIRDEGTFSPSGEPMIENIDGDSILELIKSVAGGPWYTEAGKQRQEEWVEDNGFFYTQTGWDIFDITISKPEEEGPLIDDGIGGMMPNPSTGKEEFVDSNVWARNVRALHARAGGSHDRLSKKFDQFTAIQQEFLAFTVTPVYQDYYDYAPETDAYGELLPGEQATVDYHNEYRMRYPEMDAHEFLFGSTTTLKTGEALDIVTEWIDKWQIPVEAVPQLEGINVTDLMFKDNNRHHIDRYLQDHSTHEGRDSYFGQFPDFAYDYHYNQSIELDVPVEFREDYAQYYQLQYESLRKTKFDDEWYLMDHNDFYEWLRDVGRKAEPLEVWRYPMSPNQDGGSEWKMYQTYEAAPSVDAKLLLRCDSKVFDNFISRINQLQLCHGTDRCKRIISEKGVVSPWASEAEAAVGFTKYQ